MSQGSDPTEWMELVGHPVPASPRESRGWECGCVPDQKYTACPLHAKSDVYLIPAPVASGTPCKHRFEGYNDTCLECGVSFPMSLPNLPPAPAAPKGDGERPNFMAEHLCDGGVLPCPACVASEAVARMRPHDDPTDSPLFREAVEAMRERFQWAATANTPFGDAQRMALEDALPFLRRLITEENAAKLEAEAMRPHRAGIPRNKGWYEAAAYLRGTR